MNRSPRKLYRARDGMFFGVCLGLARYRDMPVQYLRIFVVILTVMTGLWPGILLYILAAVLLKPEPVIPPKDSAEATFYARFTGSRAVALHELTKRMEQLGARIESMEHVVTSHDFDWDSRFEKP